MKSIVLKHKFLFSILTTVLSVSSIFLSGFYSGDAKFERIADYASFVAENQCNGGLFSISVENTKNKGSLLPPDNELYNLYGIFKQEKITFASTINASKKEHTILLRDGTSTNLSFLYLGPTGTIEYKGHYKHYVFPVEMMFKDNQSKAYEASKYVCYLSKSQAIRILDRQNGLSSTGVSNYSHQDFEKLLYTPITIDIDGDNRFTFSIINIYFEDNYYCSGLTSVMGEYIMCSYYLPLDLRQDQKSLYFMSKYSYQNRYFMNYINQVYPGEEYSVSVNSLNIKGNYDDDLITSFRFVETENETMSYIFISLFVLFSVFFVYTYVISKGKINLFLILLGVFCPYYVFKIIKTSSNNVAWFSLFSTRTFLIYVIAVLLFLILYKTVCFSMNKRTNLFQFRKMYEIDI